MKDDVLRTPEMLAQYFKHLDEVGTRKSLTELPKLWVSPLWFIAENGFPYDRIAAKHDLLIPVRVFADDWHMTFEERQELMMLKKQFSETGEYDSVFENVAHRRTVHNHYHLHLIKYKAITDYKHE